MPWAPSDATKHTKKANTPKKKRQFSEVANQVLASTGDEGRAIREANAAVAGTVKHKRKPDTEGHAAEAHTRSTRKQSRHSLVESHTYNWRSRENLR